MIDNETLQNLAKAIAVNCVRNDPTLEEIHSGKSPGSKTGDYSDVTVTDADGNTIAWNEASKITQEEMKAMMKNISNHLYNFLLNMQNESFMETFFERGRRQTIAWDMPEIPKSNPPAGE